jgi:hypothetical protein
LNHYVKGESAARVLTRATTDVSLLRYASEPGNNGPGVAAIATEPRRSLVR